MFDKQTNLFPNWKSVDVTLTNKKHSEVMQGGISDHHSFVVTSLKSQLVKGNAKTKISWGYSKFNIGGYRRPK